VVSVTSPPAPPVAVPAAPPPTPQVGKSAAVYAMSGTVTVACGGGKAMVLGSGQLVTTGCAINATQGSITLTFATPQGVKTATFSGGSFQLTQAPSGAVEITLVTPPVHRSPGASAARPAVSTRPGHLWVTVHKGRYSVRGCNSVATVRRSAKWETIETSGGTRTVVKRGEVSVRNLRHRMSVLVHAGHSYLAKH
jgi:hypothetical protein